MITLNVRHSFSHRDSQIWAGQPQNLAVAWSSRKVTGRIMRSRRISSLIAMTQKIVKMFSYMFIKH